MPLSRATARLAGAALAALAGVPMAASAGESACHVWNGVLVVPAKAAGLNGQFILDTGAAKSQIDATQASLAGLEAGPAEVPVRLGGRGFEAVTMEVTALDARTRALPTPIAGVLGADVLDGLVLEVRPGPCRFRLSARPGRGGRPVASLAVERRGGVPFLVAGISDGMRGERGRFRISTGADLAVRLAPAAARIEGAAPGARDPTAPLRALSIGEALIEEPQSGVAETMEPDVLGEIGEPVWARFGFRLDLKAGRLTLFAPNEKTRRRGSGGS